MIIEKIAVDFSSGMWYNAQIEWELWVTMLHRGRIARDRAISAVRELERDDLEVLRPARPPPVVERFRDSHHWVARYLAAGMTVTEVAEATGYSMNRVMQLKQVPAFQNLVAHYRNLADDGYKGVIIDYTTLKMSNRLKAERQLSEKLDKSDEEGELLPTRELISISREQDRSTNIQVNVGDFAQQLDQAITRSSKVIEGTPVLPRPQSSGPIPAQQRNEVGQAPRRKFA